MDHGKIIAGGTKEDIKANVAGDRELDIEYAAPEPVADESFLAIEGVRKVVPTKSGIMITSDAGKENLDRVIAVLMGAKAKIRSIASREASLETAFLRLTGTTLRD